jgi:hypothetical protein
MIAGVTSILKGSTIIETLCPALLAPGLASASGTIPAN